MYKPHIEILIATFCFQNWWSRTAKALQSWETSNRCSDNHSNFKKTLTFLQCTISTLLARRLRARAPARNSIAGDHKDFEGVCLNVWVLQTAHFNYRQQYGEAVEKTVHGVSEVMCIPIRVVSIELWAFTMAT